MGIISVLSFVGLFVLLFIVREHIGKATDESEDPEVKYWGRWGQMFLVFAIIINGVWVVDTFIYKFPNPFDGPKAENLDPHPADVEKPAPLKLKADPSTPDVSKAREEHKKQLDTFEGKTTPP